ncbi:MAG: pyridoxamine 5'-phosphate oxidase family protein [Clostridia bacterium]|nr:pyridoxamine 5'-phosphate oxidase family protein [Clostridia bacterium]
MFRQMRRANQQLSQQECEEILIRASSGVLSVSGDDGYPYGVPLSYVYDRDNNAIYFHCAKAGHKLDAIRRNDKASLCVIAKDDVVESEYTTYYKSVIVFGKVKEITQEPDKTIAVAKLAIKYCPQDSDNGREEEINRYYPALNALELKIEHISGKQAKELIRR